MKYFFHLLAASATPIEEVAAEASNYNYWNEFLHTIFSLALILLVVGLLFFFIKKFLKKRVEHANKTSLLKVLEKRSLTPKCHVYVLDIQNHIVLIGESPEGLHPLGHWPSHGNAPASFADLIKSPKLAENQDLGLH